MEDTNDFPSAELVDAREAFAQMMGGGRGSAQDAVDRYTHCALCGGHLHFTHATDFSRNLTQETAKCPECGIRVRRVMHRLQ